MAVDNIKLQQDINSLIAERQKMLEQTEQLLRNQTVLFQQMQQVLGGGKAGKQLDDFVNKTNAAKTATTDLSDAAQKSWKSIEEGTFSLEEGMKTIGGLLDKLGESLTKTLAKKAPIAFAGAAGAATGFAQGLENIFNVAKSLGGILGSIVDGVLSIGKSILAIPFKILDSLIDKATSGGGANELMQAFEDLRKEFGSFKEDVSKNVIKAAESMRGELAETGLSTFHVFGNLAQKLKYFTELAEKMGPTFHAFGKEIADNAERIGAFQKGLGLAGEDMEALGKAAIAKGKPLTETLREVANYSLQLGKDFGISQKVISKDIGKMQADVKNFGNLGVKEMGQLSVFTRKLGVEFEKVLGVVDKFDTFEDAADASAKLSQAFGANINAFEIMKEQDPGKRIDMLRKSLAAAGRSAETMSRQELKLLASQTGLDEQTAKTVFSSKNQSMSYDEIQKKGDKAQKSQISQAEAMKKLSDSIERLVQSGSMMKRGFFDTFLAGIEQGITSTPEFIQLMRNIQMALMTTFQEGVKLGKWLAQNFPGVLDMFKGLRDLFDPRKFRNLLEGVIDAIEEFVKDIGEGNGKASFPKLMKNLQDKFFKFFDKEAGPGKRLLQGAKKFFKVFFTIGNEAIKWIGQQLIEGLKWITDLLRGKAKIPGAEEASATGSFLWELISPILDTLKDLLPKVWDALKEVFSSAIDALTGWFSKKMEDPEFKAAFYNIALKLGAILGAVLFGPAILRGLATAGTAQLVKFIAERFLSGAGKKTIESTLEKGLGDIAKAVTQKGAAEGVEKMPALPPAKETKSFGQSLKEFGDIPAKDIVKAGAKLTLMALAVLPALAIFALAVLGLAKLYEAAGVDTKSIVQVLAAMVIMTASSVILLLALRAVAKVADNMGDVIKGLLAVALVMVVMGLVVAGILGLALIVQKLGGDEALKNAGLIMLGVSAMFLVAAIVVGVALVVGALIAGPQAVVAAIGLAAILVVIEAMAVTAIGIMAALDTVPYNADLKPKAEAFAKILEAISNLAGQVAKIIDAATPSFTELLRGTSTTEKFEEVRKFMNDLIGDHDHGIIGIVNTVVAAIQSIGANESTMKSAEVFANVIGGIAAMAKALTPDPDQEGFVDKYIKYASFGAIDKMKEVRQHIDQMKTVLIGPQGILNVVKDALQGISGFDESQLKGAEAFGTIISGIGNLMKALTPDPEFIKAQQTYVEQSTLGGLGTGKVQALPKDSLEKTASYYKSLIDQIKGALPELIGGSIGQIKALTQNMKPEDLKSLESVAKLIGPVFNVMGSIMGSLKDIKVGTTTKTTDADKKSVETLSQSFDSGILQTVINTFSGGITGLLTKVVGVLNGPELKNLAEAGLDKTIETVKSAFDGINSLMSGLTSLTQGAETEGKFDSDKFGAKIDNMSQALTMLLNPTGLPDLIKTINDGFKDKTKFAFNKGVVETIQEIGKNTSAVSNAIQGLDAGGSFKKAVESMGNITTAINDMASSMSDAKNKLEDMASLMTGFEQASQALELSALKQPLEVVKEIISKVSELNKNISLAGVSLPKTVVQLKAFADKAGLGGDTAFTVKNRDVTINVTFQATMSAGEVEDAIILRRSSKIRQAFNESWNDGAKQSLNDVLKPPKYE